MATEIWREFDPNHDIPIGLKNAREMPWPDYDELGDFDSDIDGQTETDVEDESELDGDYDENERGVPNSFTIVSQTVRTTKNGSQVVDVVIDVEEVEGAVKYEVRLTK